MHAPPKVFEPLRPGDPDRVGGFELRARLGSGGMGEVFLSFTEPGDPVAVKVVRREFADDPQFRARFRHEVRAARRVGGRYIAPLLEADPDASQPWLATAYVAGPTLADAVQLYGPLPVAGVIVLLSAISDALETIHAAGIVHRDLKPANVLLGADALRVIDFGIARAADATALTLSGMLIGSPQYVAPEQVLGEPPTPPGDVFALGALAHYAATGRPAFGEGPEVGVVYRVVHAEPDLAGCPMQLRSLISSCLAKNPADRPTTAEIAELCPPDEQPRSAADWLPEPVVFAIGSYGEALADMAARTEPLRSAERAAPQPPGAIEPVQSSAPGFLQDEPSQLSRFLRGDYRSGRFGTRRLALGLAALVVLAVAATGIAIGITSSDTPSSVSTLSNGPTPPPPGPPGPGGPGGPGDLGAGGQAPPLAPATSIVWTGTFTITQTGVWLDGQPPDAAIDGVHGDVREAAPGPAGELSSNGPRVRNLALWSRAGIPNGTQCRNLARTQGVWQLQVKAGDIVCALTAQRHVAVLSIEAFPNDYSGVTVFGTLWGGSPADPASSTQ